MKPVANFLTVVLFFEVATAHAQMTLPTGPGHKPDSLERCTSPSESNCDAGFARTTWPKVVPGSCGRPAFLRDLLPQGFRGPTWLEILVDESGSVASTKLLTRSGMKALDDVLVAAAKGCRFEPGTRGGTPAALPVYWAYTWEQTPTPPTVTRVVAPVPVPASSEERLKQTSEVCPTRAEPLFPRAALLRDIWGKVDVRVKIMNGVVVEVLDMSGPQIFHPAVYAALSRYKCVASDKAIFATQTFSFQVETLAAPPAAPQASRE